MHDPSAGQTRIGVAGVTHGHVGWILRADERPDIDVVGIAESDGAYAKSLMKRYGIEESVYFASLQEMLDKQKPDAVCAFGSIFDHLEVVREAAPRGVHVMVEKPLAVNMDHAREMEQLAKQYHIHLLTNYETTWYPSNHDAYHRVHVGQEIGELRKLVIHDGHRGPREIGVDDHFLKWLTDPVLNGGGAIVDFGCYGANLATWMMKNVPPISVTAITQQIKPHIYPKVDDEATIILTYPKTQVIIQASWNWPVSRKDMEIYGTTKQLLLPDSKTLLVQEQQKSDITIDIDALEPPYDDPFTYLGAVVKGAVDPEGGLSSLENNMMVVAILDAARTSAKTGKTIRFTK
jgi:predicted dehydrogenase